MYELIQRKPLFPKDSELSMITSIFGLLGVPVAPSDEDFKAMPFLTNFVREARASTLPFDQRDISPVQRSLLLHLLAVLPRQRMSASQALKHEWFKEVLYVKLDALCEWASRSDGDIRSLSPMIERMAQTCEYAVNYPTAPPNSPPRKRPSPDNELPDSRKSAHIKVTRSSRPSACALLTHDRADQGLDVLSGLPVT
jgi:serine/threonine protein kinase